MCMEMRGQAERRRKQCLAARFEGTWVMFGSLWGEVVKDRKDLNDEVSYENVCFTGQNPSKGRLV